MMFGKRKRQIRIQLEHGVLTANEGEIALQIQASIATSLKRIADALEAREQRKARRSHSDEIAGLGEIHGSVRGR